MEYRNEEVHDEQGSSQQQNQGDAKGKAEEKNDGGAISGIPKSEIEGSDADQDRGAESSIEEETQQTVKRNHWNSITFDYDDFLGGLTPA